jgi:plastocyanin
MARIVAVLASVALGIGIFVGSGNAAPGKTWKVAIGADSPDHAVQILDYYPRSITIDAGDSITFTMAAVADHTVTFLSGAKPLPLEEPQKDGRVKFPSNVAFPQGGPAYGGTGLSSSGLLSGLGKSWTVTFTKPGQYRYQCLLHPAQLGTVIVQAAGAPYPKSQADYDRLAAQARAQALAAGAKLRAATRATASKGARGTVYTAPMVGNFAQRIALYRFGSDTLTIKTGDTVKWVMTDLDEIHTVTFAGSDALPDFIVPSPKAQGPPDLYYNPKAVTPAGGSTHRGSGFYNSGILIPVTPPGPTTYSLTFTKPGTFTYWCVVHIPEGMRGTVVVTP